MQIMYLSLRENGKIHVWEDGVCGIVWRPFLAFDKGGKKIVSQSTGRACCYLEAGSLCLSSSFEKLMTNMLQQMSVCSERSQGMLFAGSKR